MAQNVLIWFLFLLAGQFQSKERSMQMNHNYFLRKPGCLGALRILYWGMGVQGALI